MLLMLQITLHVAYVHAFVNPTLFLVLHRGLRQAALDLCCGCCIQMGSWLASLVAEDSVDMAPGGVNLLLPPPPPVAALAQLKSANSPANQLHHTLVNHCFM